MLRTKPRFFATGFFHKMFPSGCAVFKVPFRPISLRELGFRRGFFKSRAFRFASRTLHIGPSHFVSQTSFPGISRSLKTIQLQEEQTIYPASSSLDFFSTFVLQRSFRFVSTWNERSAFTSRSLPRKEVIQPHLPIRLPCYDFTPVIGLTFDGWLLAVTSPASGAPNSHGVTGGVYKARERIHRGMLIRDY